MKARFAIVLLSVSVIAGAAAPVQPALADAITDAQNKANQAQAKVDANNARIGQDKVTQAAAQAQLDILNPQIALAEEKLRQENAKLDALNGQIDQAQRDLAAKKVEEARRQELLNRRMRGLYKQDGNTSFMDAIFGARTFSELVDRFMVMRDITRSDELLLQQIQQDKATIEALNTRLSQQRDQETAVAKSIQGKRDALNAQYLRQRNLRVAAATDQANEEAQRRQNQAAQAAATAEVASLTAARSRAHSSGKFAWPGVQGPITQPFGCTDFGGEPPPPEGYSCSRSQPYFHTGIDIAGPYGSEIDAADSGIAYTYPGNSGYGNHVIIIHQNGFATLYGHMSAFAIGNGLAVAKGQRIGYEGSTGFSSGPHLHFEIRLNNQPVNPCQYVGC